MAWRWSGYPRAVEKELQEYLDSCAQPPKEDGLSSFAKYRVVRLLGFSEFEETQLVYRVKPSAPNCSDSNSGASLASSEGCGSSAKALFGRSSSALAEGDSCSLASGAFGAGALAMDAPGTESPGSKVSAAEASAIGATTTKAGTDFEEEGPFVRKIIDARASGGQVYEMLFDAQKRGIEFRHIPEIIECGYEGDSLVVVTEYVEGSSLEATVNAFGPSEQLACRAFLSLCDAVIELHELMERPVIHRDLKPSNIMLSDGRVMLIDFGISRVFKEGACRDTRQFGTRSYAPPEQFGFGQTSIRSDVYALGMVLYFCLTGSQPMSSLADGGRPDSISSELWDVILVATRFDPNARFADVRALKSAAEWAFSRCLQEGDQGGSPSAIPDGSGRLLGMDGGAAASAGARPVAGAVGTGAPAGAVGAVPVDAVGAGVSDSWRPVSRPAEAPGQRQAEGPWSKSESSPRSLGSWPVEAPDQRQLKGPWSVATSGGRALSWLWNGLLLMVSLLLWFGLVESIIQPSQPESAQDAVIRFFEGVGLLVLPVNLLAYGLADLRKHERFPLAGRSWLSRLGLMAKASVVVFFASFFVVGLFFPA